MRTLALAVALAGLAAEITAQTRPEKHSPLGLTLTVPKKYSPMPVRPNEREIVLRYTGEAKDGAYEPELFVLRIDWQADPDPVPDPPPLTTFERFLEQRMKDWSIREERDAALCVGWTGKEYEIERKPRAEALGLKDEHPVVVRAFALKKDARSWILLGFSARDEVDKRARAWRQCAEKLEFFEPTAVADAERWRRFYSRHAEFKNPEYRIQVRSRMVDGWESEDTPNFIYVYSTQKNVLMRDVQKKLEGIRKLYVELFPPAADITAVSTARVCKDADEYYEYGGSSGTAGYWNNQAEELVFYDSGKEDTRIVLYHEAFHQYVYYAVGQFDPHQWFNEGYGDYFSGAEFNTFGDVIRINQNPWRVARIQHEIGNCSPWSKLIRMDRNEFYDTVTGGKARPINYAMAWSMIYFLHKAKAVEKNPAWARILPTYFETFKTACVRERKRLAAAGTADKKEELDKAGATAREEAVTAAFEGVDLDEIEAAWEEFVLGLKPPK